MSLEAWVAVLEAAISDGPRKAVLSGLANHAGPDGKHAYPSVVRLSVYTGLTDRTVTRILGELVADGLVSIVRQGGGRGHPTEYAVNINALAEMRDPRLEALDMAVRERDERVTASQGSPAAEEERVTATRERVTATTGNPDRESPEPYLTVLNHVVGRGNQDPWIRVLIEAKRVMSNGGRRPNNLFAQYVEPTELLGIAEGIAVVHCELGEDQAAWLKDHLALTAAKILMCHEVRFVFNPAEQVSA